MGKIKNFSRQEGFLQKLDQVPMKWLYITLAVLAISTISMSVLLGIQMVENKKHLEKSQDFAGHKVNPNYIQLSQTQYISNKPLRLVKMLSDSIATVFYFEQQLPLMDYEIVLKDDRGKMYSMDLDPIYFDQTMNTDQPMVLRFSPLDLDVKEFTIEFIERYSGELAVFSVALSKALPGAPVKYLPERVYGEDQEEGVQVSLEEVVFAPSGTVVNYQIHWGIETDRIVHGWTGIPAKDLIQLEEGSRRMLGIKPVPSLYIFPREKRILGAAIFEPVHRLDSRIYMKLQHLYKYVAVEQELSLKGLLEGDETEVSVEVLEHTLILESLAMLQDRFFLPYHLKDGKDLRKEIQMEAELVIRDLKGLEVVLDGQTTAKEERGGISFPTKDAQVFLGDIKNKQIYVRIKAVGIRIPDIGFTMDLSEIQENIQDTELMEAKAFILDSFQKRLAVKSGKSKKEELRGGFTESILEEEGMIADYFKQTALVEEVQYTTQITGMGVSAYGNVYAVVQDVWKGRTDTAQIHFYRTHKVIARKYNDQWMITEDTILR